MMRTPARVATIALVLAACGGRDATPSRATPLADTCSVQLAPRQGPLEAAAPAPAPPPPTRSSRLVTHVELKLASLSKQLEGHVPPRLVEERNHSIGIGGHLNYTVDRGPFTVAVEGDALVIRTDVRGHAEACRGGACYASCEPQGRATATVPLRLTADYRFAPSHVVFAFTRGCEVRALGGILKIDVTPTIQGQLGPSLRRVEQEIDGKLPPLRPEAERLWTELGKTRNVPLGGCIVTNPRGIVEGPVSGTPETLRIRFGLVAYPEIRSRCGDVSGAPPLPPLAQDPALPPEDDLVLTLISPLAVIAHGLESTDPFDSGGQRARIARATGVPAGALAQIDLGLRGGACGDVAVRSPLAWSDDGRTLRLASPVLITGERERAPSLAHEVLLRSLAELRFAPPLPPDTLKDLVPTIASSMSDPSVDVNAKVSDVKPFAVDLRGEDVAAAVLVRGSVELKQR